MCPPSVSRRCLAPAAAARRRRRYPGSLQRLWRSHCPELARRGMDIYGVHLDRRSTMPHVRASPRRSARWGAASGSTSTQPTKPSAKRSSRRVAAATTRSVGPSVRVFVHSLAFGTLRPFVPAGRQRRGDLIGKTHLEMTCDVMAHSLLYWTQDLLSPRPDWTRLAPVCHDFSRRSPRDR